MAASRAPESYTPNEHFTDDEKEAWREALHQHKSIVTMVSNNSSYRDWIHRAFPTVQKADLDCEFRINLAEMQRMYLRFLQFKLVRIGFLQQFHRHRESRDEKQEKLFGTLRNLAPTLAKYTQAVRDYEYMMTSSRDYDYFVVSPERYHDRNVIQMITRVNTYADAIRVLKSKLRKRPMPSTGPWEEVKDGTNRYAEPIGGTRHDSIRTVLRRAFWWKLFAATFGAGFLIGPMWALALKEGLYFQLGLTSGFVFSFGILLAYFVERIDQVFAGTLAYAAVLMVFVGLSVQWSRGA